MITVEKDIENKLKTIDDLINNIFMPDNIYGEISTGVDLGTSSIIFVSIDEKGNPVSAELEWSEALRDGLVVDYRKCVDIVSELKSRTEERLNTELKYAACAIPPNTESGNSMVCRYICQEAGFEVTDVFDEPTAASKFLGIDNGVVVDIGGGTTGISLIENKEVVSTADEATGGTHISLVLMHRYGITFKEAEEWKKDPEKIFLVISAVKPVIEKMGYIVKKFLNGLDYHIYLVGGTPMLSGFADIFKEEVGIKNIDSFDKSIYITPFGIAEGCRERVEE